MIRMNVHYDASGALKKLNGLTQSIQDKIAARAINYIAQQVKTEAVRNIAGEFNVSHRQVRDRIIVDRARAQANVIKATVRVPEARGRFRALHISDLKGTNDLRWSSGRIGQHTLRAARRARGGKMTTKAGVQYMMLKGKGKELLPNAFIAPGKKSGKMIVFQRADQSNPRSKLKAMYRIDVPQMFNTKRLNARLMQLINEKLPGEIVRLMKLELSKS